MSKINVFLSTLQTLSRCCSICLMPNWHGIVSSISLSFHFTLPASLPLQHIDCAVLSPQTQLPQASYFHSVLSSSTLSLLALSCTVYTLLTLV